MSLKDFGEDIPGEAHTVASDIGKVKYTYAEAGVDIAKAERAKELLKKLARSTFSPRVVGDIGSFGGVFEFQGYQQPLLVSSVDGVGTKLKIASSLGRHDTVGVDLVHHCVNDILTCGAKPLFFLDYIGAGRLIPEQIESIIQGIATACREVGCALIGGETAEMPGVYAPEEYDLVGFIVGVVEKSALIDGSSIKVADAIIGLPSSGLHTNGYSLVRKIFGTEASALNIYYSQLGRTLGEELLEPHRCYYSLLQPVLPLIKGMAHITGGGLLGNIPRVLPPGLAARLHLGSWNIPPVFHLLQQRGNVDAGEMFRVFNMGLGMVVFCSPDEVSTITRSVAGARLVGEVIAQEGEQRVLIANSE
jgi:phosphoribosylformylglycinamidine cyclo-ligase